MVRPPPPPPRRSPWVPLVSSCGVDGRQFLARRTLDLLCLRDSGLLSADFSSGQLTGLQQFFIVSTGPLEGGVHRKFDPVPDLPALRGINLFPKEEKLVLSGVKADG